MRPALLFPCLFILVRAAAAQTPSPPHQADRNGRARGNANTVSPEGPKAAAIDTTLPPGTVDDNAIQFLLPALPWTPSANWSFGVFSAGQNEYRVTTLRVVAVETIKLDSGPVEASKAE